MMTNWQARAYVGPTWRWGQHTALIMYGESESDAHELWTAQVRGGMNKGPEETGWAESGRERSWHTGNSAQTEKGKERVFLTEVRRVIRRAGAADGGS